MDKETLEALKSVLDMAEDYTYEEESYLKANRRYKKCMEAQKRVEDFIKKNE